MSKLTSVTFTDDDGEERTFTADYDGGLTIEGPDGFSDDPADRIQTRIGPVMLTAMLEALELLEII